MTNKNKCELCEEFEPDQSKLGTYRLDRQKVVAHHECYEAEKFEREQEEDDIRSSKKYRGQSWE